MEVNLTVVLLGVIFYYLLQYLFDVIVKEEVDAIVAKMDKKPCVKEKPHIIVLRVKSDDDDEPEAEVVDESKPEQASQ